MAMDTSDDGNAEALKDARVCTDIGNAILRAKKRDPVAAAHGLLSLAVVLVEGNAEATTGLAIEMIRTALELDPHLAQVRWQ